MKNNTAVQATAISDTKGSYIAKLTPGAYNVTVKTSEGSTTVYTFAGSLSVTKGQGVATYNLQLIKQSVTVSGTATYNTLGKANMTLLFSKILTVANNTAITTNAKTGTTGTYTIELTPGSYNVTVETLVNESGQNFTYRGTAQITVFTGEAPRTLTIALTREQTP
jgi:uncharacterized membrane protein